MRYNRDDADADAADADAADADAGVDAGVGDDWGADTARVRSPARNH